MNIRKCNLMGVKDMIESGVNYKSGECDVMGYYIEHNTKVSSHTLFKPTAILFALVNQYT